MSYKKLFVLRHAKSSWDEPDKDDFDRALTTRGINDAYDMANRLKSRLNKVDLILTSYANRATHTATIFAGVIGFPFDKMKLSANLYEISEKQLVSLIQDLPNDLHSVIIVGHNPTFTYFVNRFLKSPIENIPTAGMVGMSFDTHNWKDISKENLHSSFFEFPKKEQ